MIVLSHFTVQFMVSTQFKVFLLHWSFLENHLIEYKSTWQQSVAMTYADFLDPPNIILNEPQGSF